MINKPPPFKGLNVSIPVVIPVKGRGGVINQGSRSRNRFLSVLALPEDSR